MRLTRCEGHLNPDESAAALIEAHSAHVQSDESCYWKGKVNCRKREISNWRSSTRSVMGRAPFLHYHVQRATRNRQTIASAIHYRSIPAKIIQRNCFFFKYQHKMLRIENDLTQPMCETACLRIKGILSKYVVVLCCHVKCIVAENVVNKFLLISSYSCRTNQVNKPKLLPAYRCCCVHSSEFEERRVSYKTRTFCFAQ